MPKTRSPYAAEFRQQMRRPGSVRTSAWQDLQLSERFDQAVVDQVDPPTWVRAGGPRCGKDSSATGSADGGAVTSCGGCAGRTGALREEREILAKATAWFARDVPDPAEIYRFMSANQARFRVDRTMATKCSASPRAGTTRGVVVTPSARARADAELRSSRPGDSRPQSRRRMVLLGFTPS